MDKELHGYIDWICKAEEAILKEEKTTELERRHIMESKFEINLFLLIQHIKTSEIIKSNSIINFNIFNSQKKLCNEKNQTWW